MTTLPEEAVKAAQKAYRECEGDSTESHRAALTAAIPFLSVQGAVKKLEWREDKYPKSYISGIGPLTYSVFWDDEAEWSDIAAPYDLILGDDDGDTLGSFETVEAAKAAAQADYEARILSALEPSAGRAAVLEEAARLDAATAALISLTEAGIPTDVQELLIVGDPSRGIAPGSLSKAIATVIRALASHPVADKPDEAGAQGEGWLPTYRHKKRGTEYLLIGIGKMQADNWQVSREGFDQSIDMEEVAIYRSLDDGKIWVRPREEFEDGRFETLPTPPSNEVA